jgi:hypothetical protein
VTVVAIRPVRGVGGRGRFQGLAGVLGGFQRALDLRAGLVGDDRCNVMTRMTRMTCRPRRDRVQGIGYDHEGTR